MKTFFIAGIAMFFWQASWSAIDKNKPLKISLKPIVVAVIDTGVDVNHSFLQDNLWVNEGESGKDAFGFDKEHNHIDDDQNGYIDDVHGWNFIDNNNDVQDTHGHGTHIAGIIKTQFKQKAPQVSDGKNLQLMILKYYSTGSKNSETITASIKAIRYANAMKAKIINYSGGGPQQSNHELKALLETQRKNIIFVAAAGNNKENTDVMKFYPASYRLSNMISVGASSEKGDLLSFSNFGKESVDILAMGSNVVSTLPKNKYGVMSGTSQATALVSGWIAGNFTTWGQELSATEILARISKSTMTNQKLQGKTKYQIALITEN